MDILVLEYVAMLIGIHVQHLNIYIYTYYTYTYIYIYIYIVMDIYRTHINIYIVPAKYVFSGLPLSAP